VLIPNDFHSLQAVVAALDALEPRHNQVAKPFD